MGCGSGRWTMVHGSAPEPQWADTAKSNQGTNSNQVGDRLWAADCPMYDSGYTNS